MLLIGGCATSLLDDVVSVELHEDHKADTKMTYIWPPLISSMLPDLKQWYLLDKRASKCVKSTSRNQDNMPTPTSQAEK